MTDTKKKAPEINTLEEFRARQEKGKRLSEIAIPEFVPQMSPKEYANYVEKGKIPKRLKAKKEDKSE